MDTLNDIANTIRYMDRKIEKTNMLLERIAKALESLEKGE